MSRITVRKQLELSARDAVELSRRIGRFRNALRARNGAILDIEWHDGSATSARSASIVYQLPLSATGAEMPVQ